MSVDAWRDMERASRDRRHEYIDGQVYAMAGGTLDHSQTSINAVLVLRQSLGRGPCRVYNSDAAARLSATRFTYPDATVTCDERDRGGVTEIQAPRVIVEVLSPDSTEGYDRGRKMGYYRACPTIQELVLVATDRQVVEVYRRTAEGWRAFQAYGRGEEIELTSINARFAVAALYDLTEVPESLDAPEGAV